MKRQPLRTTQPLIQKQYNLMTRVINQPKRTNRPRTQPQITHHTPLRRKRQLTLTQPALQIMHINTPLTIQHHKIMLITLMIPQKDILAMLPLQHPPIPPRILNSRCRRMLYILKPYTHLGQQRVQLLLAYPLLFHNNVEN